MIDEKEEERIKKELQDAIQSVGTPEHYAYGWGYEDIREKEHKPTLIDYFHVVSEIVGELSAPFYVENSDISENGVDFLHLKWTMVPERRYEIVTKILEHRNIGFSGSREKTNWGGELSTWTLIVSVPKEDYRE